MIVSLCGAPGSGKQALAKAVIDAIPQFRVLEDPVHTLEGQFNTPLGMMADYRTDIALMGLRAMLLHRHFEEDIILTHSLMDSVAYSQLKMMDLTEHSLEPQGLRWAMVMSMAHRVASDTMFYDFFFHLPGYENDGLEYNSRVGETLIELVELNIPEIVHLEGDLEKDTIIVKEIIERNYATSTD